MFPMLGLEHALASLDGERIAWVPDNDEITKLYINP